ncbi:hypothetical protein ABZ312_11460 [Streptomyces sp. NPDC006207]
MPITAPAGVDLTGAPVRIAIVAHAENPSESEWQTAEWVDDVARLLIGPDGGAIALTRGDYRVWVAVDPAGPENIVRQSGALSII